MRSGSLPSPRLAVPPPELRALTPLRAASVPRSPPADLLAVSPLPSPRTPRSPPAVLRAGSPLRSARTPRSAPRRAGPSQLPPITSPRQSGDSDVIPIAVQIPAFSRSRPARRSSSGPAQGSRVAEASPRLPPISPRSSGLQLPYPTQHEAPPLPAASAKPETPPPSKPNRKPQNVIEVYVPEQHPLFELGGRNGDVVVRVLGAQNSRVEMVTDEAINELFLIQKGWKLIAFNGARLGGQKVLASARAAQKQGAECILAFEVDEEFARRLGRQLLRKSLARLELRDMLGNRTLEELDALPREQKAEYLRSLRFQWLVVDASAIFEVEVLLSRKSGSLVQLARDLFRAVKRDDQTAVQRLASDPRVASHNVLLQRDGCGNVAVHHATSLAVMEMLVDREPAAMRMENWEGQMPLHTYLARGQEDWSVIEKLAPGLDDMLRADSRGICAAMWLAGKLRGFYSSRLPPWGTLEAALEQEIGQIIPALNEIEPKGFWKQLVGFYCFPRQSSGEPFLHTDVSTRRLSCVWRSMERIIKACSAHDGTAPDILRELLQGSKGPREPGFDPREPYREQLMREICKAQVRTKYALGDIYNALSSEAGHWVKSLESSTSVDPSVFVQLGLDPSALPAGGLRFKLDPPKWLAEPDLTQVFDDLQAVGMIQYKDVDQNGVVELLHMAEVSYSGFEIDEEDCAVARWYAAWLRGVCNQKQAEIANAMQALLGPVAQPDASFFARREAKGYERVVERMHEAMRTLLDEFRRASMSPESRTAKECFRQAAAFVVDINGCTLTIDTVEELKEVYEQLASKVRRTKNGFHKDKQSPAGYRDLKVFVELDNKMIVEQQLLLRSFYNEKHYMHVPYEVVRGSLDWPHLKTIVDEMVKAQTQKLSRVETAIRRKALGETADMLKADGFAIDELTEARFSVEELWRAQFSVAELRTVGASIPELKGAGCEASPLRQAGIALQDLHDVGFGPMELFEAGFNVFALQEVGFDLQRFRDAGFSAQSLREGGYRLVDLIGAAFSGEELRSAGFNAMDLHDIGLSTKEMLSAGFDAELVKSVGGSGREMRAAGFGVADLQELDFTGRQMREAGFEAQDLLNVQFSVRQLREAGFNAQELKDVGCALQEIRLAGFGARDMKETGCTGQQLREIGFDATDLKDADFSARQMHQAGFEANDLKQVGFSAYHLREGGFDAKEVKDASFALKEMRRAGFDAKDLKIAGCSCKELRETEFTAKDLREAGFSGKDLRHAGFSAEDLKAVRYSSKQLREAGFSALAVWDAGFLVNELCTAGYTAAELHEAGFDAQRLKSGGCSGKELFDAGFQEAEMRDAGFTASQLREAGFSAKQLKAVGCSGKELFKAGFGILELRDAGFDTMTEI